MSPFGFDSATLTIVCSDAARNGKTLFSKLLADTCCLRYGAPPKIFDTDSRGSLSSHFTDYSRIIDLSRTGDQVGLFDRVLLSPSGSHFLVDLSSGSLQKFFDIYCDINFTSGAIDSGITVYVFFVVDRVPSSVEVAVALRRNLAGVNFIPVRNSAIGDALDAPGVRDLYDELGDNEILLPELSGEALGYLEHIDFHFDLFLAGRYDSLRYDVRSELLGFLESVYEQRSDVSVL